MTRKALAKQPSHPRSEGPCWNTCWCEQPARLLLCISVLKHAQHSWCAGSRVEATAEPQPVPSPLLAFTPRQSPRRPSRRRPLLPCRRCAGLGRSGRTSRRTSAQGWTAGSRRRGRGPSRGAACQALYRRGTAACTAQWGSGSGNGVWSAASLRSSWIGAPNCPCSNIAH